MSPLLHDVVYKNVGLNWAQLRLDSTDMELFLKLRQDPKFYGKAPIITTMPQTAYEPKPANTLPP